MVGKLDDYLRFNELALSLRAQRQQVLASNIANADTPNFKARDIDFGTALQDALTRSAPAAQPGRPDPAHLRNARPGDTLADGTPLLYRVPDQAAADGNTVDMDVERNQFADNAVRYEAGITMVNMQIKSMIAAIQGS